ncbi:hypothetical protein DPMN_030517 [Dreissena polymorpha]|uniref:Zinc finger double-stranded RNA binding domain-containing protein n=1 Tax=Dreissena polymorpha TaxID=45954 RepID=A0A9D4RG88_DREPO|nr:hypothetical protein DPMN_030517 [Dreissena polymorpha]
MPPHQNCGKDKFVIQHCKLCDVHATTPALWQGKFVIQHCKLCDVHATTPNLWQGKFVIQHCKLCDVHATTPEMWQVHIKSKRHRKCEQSRRRKLRDLTQTLDEYIHHQQVQDGDSGT